MNSLVPDAKPLSVIAGKMLWQVPGRVKTPTFNQRLPPLHQKLFTLIDYIKRVSSLLQVIEIRQAAARGIACL